MNAKLVGGIIVLISLFFVLVYLVQSNILIPIIIVDYPSLLLSLIFLFAAHLFDALCLKTFMKLNNVRFSSMQAVVATGKFALAKYIPGKIGVIIGKAAYLSEKANIGKFQSLEMVTLYQVLFVVSAAVLSLLTSYDLIKKQSVNYLLVIIILIMGIILLSFKRMQLFIKKVINKALPVKFSKVYSQKSIAFVLLGTTCCWILWALGFFFLGRSVGIEIPFQAAMVFLLASIIGIITFFAPGGIGVKEGILSAGLIFYGISRTRAISLSVYSRLWFLLGELVLFLMAVAISYAEKHSREKKDVTVDNQ